jgi:hypothetical protein
VEQGATQHLIMCAGSILREGWWIWRKRIPASFAKKLTLAANGSSPAFVVISARVEFLCLSPDKVAVLEEDAYKQGMNEAQAVAHGRLGARSSHL